MNLFQEGVCHILNKDAIDHILFLFVLSFGYTFLQWKRVLLLATAFTIGHSLTLALSLYEIVDFRMKWVEFLIATSIFISALIKWVHPIPKEKMPIWNYLLILGFGLLHGLGFSSTLKMLYDARIERAKGLFLFNSGVEIGQIVIISAVVLIFSLLSKVEMGDTKHLTRWLVGLVLLFSAWMMVQNIPLAT